MYPVAVPRFPYTALLAPGKTSYTQLNNVSCFVPERRAFRAMDDTAIHLHAPFPERRPAFTIPGMPGGGVKSTRQGLRSAI